MELKRFICSFSWILLFFKNFRKYNAMNSIFLGDISIKGNNVMDIQNRVKKFSSSQS